MNNNSKMPKGRVPRTLTNRWRLLAGAVCAAALPSLPALAATDTTAILQAAQSTPAEFQADTLLRVVVRQRVEQGKNWPLNREQAIARLEQVYSLGFTVKTKLPTRPVASASNEELMRWISVPLDRISLQMAAATEMVALDATRAMAMFERDEKLKPVLAGCGAVEFEDYSKIYSVADKLLSAQFTPDPKFVEERLDRSKSPTSIAPIVNMALQKRFSAQNYADIARWTGDALNRMRGNDQAFAAALGDVSNAVAALSARLGDLNLDDSGLKKAFAAFLTANISGPRCAENLSGEPFEVQQAVVEGWREALQLTLPQASEAAQRLVAPESATERLLMLSTDVIDAINGNADGVGALTGTALVSKINELLNAVDAAASLPEDAASTVYKARTKSLLNLLNFAPAGAQRERAKQTLMGLITNSPLYQKDRVDWFYGVKWLMVSMENWSDRVSELKLLEASTNPVLRTYALLTKEGMIDPEDAQPSP